MCYFCLVAEIDGLRGQLARSGDGLSASVPMHVLRDDVPAPEQAHETHSVAQPRVPQVSGNAAPPVRHGGARGPHVAPHGDPL